MLRKEDVDPRFERSAMAHSFIWIALVFSLGVGIAQAEDERPSELLFESSEKIPSLELPSEKTPARVITISDHMLKPQVITIQENERVAWFSYSRAPTRVRFEREVAKDVVCRGLVNFSIKEDELLSGELRPLDKANFCIFKPGRYRYQVVRNDPHNAAKLRLDGVIVVEARDCAEGEEGPGCKSAAAGDQGAVSSE